MKKLLKLAMIIIAMTCCSSVVIAENTSDTTNFYGIQVQDLKIERIDDSLYLNLNIDMSHLDIATTELAVLTPYIINTEDSTMFNAIGVYGRNRMIYYQRFPELNPIHRECEALEYKEKEKETDLFDEYQKIKMIYGETEEIIKRAKEFLNDRALQEFDMQIQVYA